MLNQEYLECILNPESESKFYQSKDLVDYSKYKKGEPYYDENISPELKEEYEIDMKILSLLENLGYPMDELGTFLYKELIHELCREIKGMTKREDMKKCDDLISELGKPFSRIYHLVAREYLEIGIKSFHLNVESALDKIDSSKVDELLALRVYGSNPEQLDYGKQALLYAGYILGRYSKSYEMPKIKRIGIQSYIK